MVKNQIPKTYAEIVELAVKGHAGAQTYGETVGLEHHTDSEIATDLYDLIGNPATPLVPGKQSVLNTRKQSVKAARVAAIAAVAAGKEYCRLGISLLKSVLGTSYNSSWSAAGFLSPSLKVPGKPVPMLIEFRQYFDGHAAHENAATGITAAQATAKLTAIQSAELALASAEAARITAKKARDFALRALQKRMSGLRSELTQVLAADDGTWLEFGFRVPAGGQIPDLVTGLQVSPGLAGTVQVTWEFASLANNYRVTWRPSSSSDPSTVVGLFSDLQCLLTGLPSGVPIVVGVSARNDSGETSATEATITVP